ncbi:MAG: 4Fe-4S binding protein [Eubacteriales bacterium]
MDSQHFYIIGSNCISCGKCTKVCESQAITTNFANKFNISNEICTGCGQCREICPVSAICDMED